MRFIYSLIIALIAVSFASAAIAGTSQNNKLKAGETLLIGGTQPGWITIDGQNRGDTPIRLKIRSGDTETEIITVAPNQGFNQPVRKNKILVIQNMSDAAPTRVYWHISRYSKSANPRIEGGPT